MVTRFDKKIIQIIKKAGVIRASDIELQGIHRKHLAALVQNQTLQRVGRGLYRLSGTSATEHQTLGEVCKAVPKGVICLLSALSFHKFTTQVPHEVWIALERSAWRPRIDKPKLRVVLMNKRVVETEVLTQTFNGVEVRVFSIAKTVVDCFKWRKLVGMDVALEALREFIKRPYGGAPQLMRIAGICRVQTVIEPYIEALIA